MQEGTGGRKGGNGTRPHFSMCILDPSQGVEGYLGVRVGDAVWTESVQVALGPLETPGITETVTTALVESPCVFVHAHPLQSATRSYFPFHEEQWKEK